MGMVNSDIVNSTLLNASSTVGVVLEGAANCTMTFSSTATCVVAKRLFAVFTIESTSAATCQPILTAKSAMSFSVSTAFSTALCRTLSIRLSIESFMPPSRIASVIDCGAVTFNIGMNLLDSEAMYYVKGKPPIRVLQYGMKDLDEKVGVITIEKDPYV